MPHVLTGLVCWSFVLGCGVSGCHSFLISEAYIRQCPLPLAIYPLRTCARRTVPPDDRHLCVVTVVCSCVARFPGRRPAVEPGADAGADVRVRLGAGLDLSGTLNVFFQDTQHLAEVGFQILFYLTPIIYRLRDLAQASGSVGLLQWNPVVAFLNLVRAPLLYGRAPTLNQYLYAAAIAAGLAAVAAAVLGRMQKRLIFYL